MSDASPHFPWTDEQVAARAREAVVAYWSGRSGQAARQQEQGRVSDAGSRSQVTGGQHLNGFLGLMVEVINAAGFAGDEVLFNAKTEIPGFYRPTKRWDVVVVRKNRLCAAIELKSQVGPSFGNNFNNRTEEAIGNSVDLWRAFQEGVVGSYPPWLGYFFLLEDAAGSTTNVSLSKAVFPTDPVFNNTSYADRYAILCRRLVLERNYTAAALILAPHGADGSYREPDDGLRFPQFLKTLYGHLIGCA